MRLAALALLVLACTAQAAPPAQQWYTVLLDGRKIGSFETTRTVHEGQVQTTQTLDIKLERAGISIGLRNSESTTETPAGKPLAFSSTASMSGIETRIEGRIVDGRIEATTSVGGVTQKRSLPWPEGALMPEAARLLGLRKGLTEGVHYDALAFQPSALEGVRIGTRIGPRENVELPGGPRQLVRAEQAMTIAGTTLNSRSWVDAQQTVYKLVMPLMGVDLVMLACDHACATAPNQSSDVFERTLLIAPRALSPAELAGPMRYTLGWRGSGKYSGLINTDEQSVKVDGAARVLTVDPEAHAASAAERPGKNELRPSDYLQSEAPEIIALARKAVGDAQSPQEKMQRIETFVRGFISNKNLNVGYASALEVARKPEGDCTEHAVLVAALGRASGVATRVATGLAYAPGFAGKDSVFVPHAWAQAWIDGRWRSFDAALKGFDSGHIAFAVGDGDPWKFFAGLELLGNLELKAVEPVSKPAATPAH
ncbi:MAG: transglutaminase domain-containing protein [Dokdonella sp.]|uniref:transglutaminase-like domain-containing protein n=1 Tax=Dokdonella sp. TaxID=2291710 RepID=UPI0025C21A11|nr:transglutaminase-like domain-containing protein [Dokdonella sp.]MBZ0222540.1 transglutaminase-like domain-containing protein [Dokdonella sp.]MCC7256128.1 transglutaminase domain-containing protein [Dokdonella sp.]